MSEQTACGECGMLIEAGEYHPYIACLAFKQCRDGHMVPVNLRGLRYRAQREEREACAKVCENLRFTELGPTLEAKHQRNLCAQAIRQREGA